MMDGPAVQMGSGGLDRQDADDASAGAVVFEPDSAGHLGEDRVVFPATGIQAGPEASTALAYDDRAARDEIAVVSLDAQPLRIRIAAVA